MLFLPEEPFHRRGGGSQSVHPLKTPLRSVLGTGLRSSCTARFWTALRPMGMTTSPSAPTCPSCASWPACRWRSPRRRWAGGCGFPMLAACAFWLCICWAALGRMGYGAVLGAGGGGRRICLGREQHGRRSRRRLISSQPTSTTLPLKLYADACEAGGGACGARTAECQQAPLRSRPAAQPAAVCCA